MVAKLARAGGNRVSGRMPALVPGERLFVRVTLGDGSIVVGEFRVPQRGEVRSPSSAAKAR